MRKVIKIEIKSANHTHIQRVCSQERAASYIANMTARGYQLVSSKIVRARARERAIGE